MDNGGENVNPFFIAFLVPLSDLFQWKSIFLMF